MKPALILAFALPLTACGGSATQTLLPAEATDETYTTAEEAPPVEDEATLPVEEEPVLVIEDED